MQRNDVKIMNTIQGALSILKKNTLCSFFVFSKEVAGELRFDSDFLGEQPTTIDRDQVIEVIKNKGYAV